MLVVFPTGFAISLRVESGCGKSVIVVSMLDVLMGDQVDILQQ